MVYFSTLSENVRYHLKSPMLQVIPILKLQLNYLFILYKYLYL